MTDYEMSLSQIEAEIPNLALPELQKLEAVVKKAINERGQKERTDLLAKMDELAKDRGFGSLSKLMQSSEAAPKKVKRPVAPKYQNPNDPSQTWTGRGRKPLWAVAALETGGNLEDMLIEPQA